MQKDLNLNIETFKKMIQCKTVSNKDSSKVDESEFEKFRQLVIDSYPLVMSQSELKIIGGGMLFKIRGQNALTPSVLMSHFDVVDVDYDSWEVDPFSATIKDDFVWGRGTIDTKCSLFSIMEAAEMLFESCFIPQHDLYFAFGCNEEIAGPCAQEIVDYLKENGVSPAFVLDEGGMIYNAGPKLLDGELAAIGIAEKGPMDVKFTVTAESGHASRPPKHTAVGQLAKDIAKIEKSQFKMQLCPSDEAMAKAVAPHLPKPLNFAIKNIRAFKPIIFQIAKNIPTAAAFFRTTIAFTQLEGSQGANVLPSSVSVVANVRLASGVSSKEAVEYMLKAANDPNLKAEILNVSEATKTSPAEGAFWDIINRSIKNNFHNVFVAPYLMIGGTDSRFYDDICPCIYKFAPVETRGGLLSTVHSNNERISISNLENMVRFFRDLISEL